MRTENVLKNGIWGVVNQIASIFLGFLGRTVFIWCLNAEYLGISGLFSNILNVLSLTELGFSTAIAFHLYKLLTDKDEKKIVGVINFYRNVYRAVALTILVIGSALIPILGQIINESSFDLSYIRIIYCIYLINTASSYLFSYNFTLAVADQKTYLITNTDTIIRIISTCLNIVVLVLFENFIIYLLVGIGMSVIGNYCKSRRVRMVYPYLSDKKQKIDQIHKKRIISDVKDIFAGKVSTVILTSTDNILISSMINLTTVGLYSNYSMIIGYVQAILLQFTAATESSIGNMLASESKDYSYSVMKKLTTIVFFAVSFCSIALFVLINPFIQLWLGDKYLLGIDVVAWCVLSFYIQMIKVPVWFSLNGVGYFKNDRNIAIIGAVSNLVFSVICANLWGLSGIFMGTVISQLIQWILKVKLFTNKYLQIKEFEYIMQSAKLLFVFFVACGITYFVCDLILIPNKWIYFIFKIIIVCIVPNLINYFVFRNTEAFGYLCDTIKKILKKSIR